MNVCIKCDPKPKDGPKPNPGDGGDKNPIGPSNQVSINDVKPKKKIKPRALENFQLT